MRRITTRKGVELLVPEKGEKHPNAGRPKGSKNVMTRLLKERDPSHRRAEQALQGFGSLAGYLTYLADNKPELFVPLLARLLPLQEKELALASKTR